MRRCAAACLRSCGQLPSWASATASRYRINSISRNHRCAVGYESSVLLLACRARKVEPVRESAHIHNSRMIGIRISRPATNGMPIRCARCLRKPCVPRRRHSRCPKNPASRKNSCIRKPWMNASKTTKPSPRDTSRAGQGMGTGASETAACKTMPSNIAVARRLSNACRRSPAEAATAGGDAPASSAVVKVVMMSLRGASSYLWSLRLAPIRDTDQHYYALRPQLDIDLILHAIHGREVNMGAIQFGVLLLVLALLVLYAVLRSRARAPSRERNDPAFFGSEMTDFVSHLHRTPPEMEPLDTVSEATPHRVVE